MTCPRCGDSKVVAGSRACVAPVPCGLCAKDPATGYTWRPGDPRCLTCRRAYPTENEANWCCAAVPGGDVRTDDDSHTEVRHA